uniref:Rho guanine nucleotide exchange factor 11 n=1 Tax=Scleropages formosus TaxID=113540 RepID=A0A8C9VI11_SCLFO
EPRSKVDFCLNHLSSCYSQGLVQRCVVVQRDQLGFGFTVCGERIKLVQNVRPGGAAVKAGVQEGDRIIKVNGSLVSSMSHQEVVKLIKSGTYVALTLQGPPPSAAAVPLQPLPTDISPNHRAAPGGEAPPPPPPPLPPTSANSPSQRITGPKPLQVNVTADPELSICLPYLVSCTGSQQAAKQSGKNFVVVCRNFWHPLLISARVDIFSRCLCKSILVVDTLILLQSNGPFQDIELLKTRPAHMTVFMRYVFSQLLDPSPLLFYLSVEAYLGSSPKDARALVHQICSHFLDPDAVCSADLHLIHSRIQAQEDIRGPLSELQQLVLPDIQDQIQDYRSKQTMGLGSLFGEGDLQQLDGDPAKERQVVDRQVSALWEILSKHEEERSSALASAVLLYLRHTGVKLRDSRLPPGLSSEKDKWLPFFPKTKKKEKDIEDKKRNPILKYIGKPRSTSQSTFHVPLSPTEVRSGNVRNIIQQFENHQPDSSGADGDLQRLSTSSLGDDILDQDSPTVSVRLARSESLKAQGEGRRRGAGAAGESVPRSRSDVDMDDCGEEREGTGLHLLHHSTSSSASSSSARSLENPTPPYTPRSRSIESPVALLPDAPALEEDISEVHNWQEMVGPEILAAIGPREVDRQAVIYELFTTEISHLRTLRVLDQVFFQKMRSVLSSDELDCIFPNLLQVYRLHAGLYESMKKLRESPIVQGIGDVMLARFEGAAGAEFQEQVSQLCCKQSQALDLIKSKQRRDQRFSHIIQECEASPYCRRLQLKDLLVSEMQRLTKYPLLLEKIIKHTDPLSPELPSLQQALVCCRGILQAVNEIVRETEHQHRLSQYQRRLDATPLERQSSTVAAQFKNLDLSTKKMIHEGVLTWRISKDKALLLSDLLVLLQKGPDERLVLRCPSRSLGGAVSGIGDTKPSLCPVIRLDSLLVRPVATDNKALYVISTSEREIYELVAGTSSEKNTSVPLSFCVCALQALWLPCENPFLVCKVQCCSCTDNLTVRFLPVERLKQLIFRSLEEDCWSQDSDDTPTNETANERSPFIDGINSEALEQDAGLKQWEHEEGEMPCLEMERGVQVVRRGECFNASCM